MAIAQYSNGLLINLWGRKWSPHSNPLPSWHVYYSAFSKSILNIWKFSNHILLKSSLENFEHYFASMWNECNCAVVWTFFAIALLGIRMKTDLSQSCDHCWIFQICWHIECSTFTASSFRIWNSSSGIPSPPLALFVLMIPKACLTLHSKISSSRWVIMPSWFSGSLRSFLHSSSVYSCHLFLMSCVSVRKMVHTISVLFLCVPVFALNIPLVSLRYQDSWRDL